jgi:hypothetical protein
VWGHATGTGTHRRRALLVDAVDGGAASPPLEKQ